MGFSMSHTPPQHPNLGIRKSSFPFSANQLEIDKSVTVLDSTIIWLSDDSLSDSHLLLLLKPVFENFSADFRILTKL